MQDVNGAPMGDSHLSRTVRQERIAEFVLQHSSVRVQELASRFNVSIMTIHRDLEELKRHGVLRKVRGGATAQPSSLFESDIRYRSTVTPRQKAAIARLAARLIEPGQAVMLDDSTTSLALAKLLPAFEYLTVITNSLSVLCELSPHKHVHLVALGGDYLPHYDAFAGILCEQAIASLRVNLLFTSTSAVLNLVAYHQEQGIIQVKRAMINSAERSILLVDSTKFGRSALHQLARLQDFDLIIVDDALATSTLQELCNAGANVQLATVGTGSPPLSAAFSNGDR
ncbi:MAG: DeoR/GlpR transcriptional regulator [Verrucomicrobia bacterium]|nr:DeoR/GlpR transcriptional regulator [Verrucomicrobiota bacterium]